MKGKPVMNWSTSSVNIPELYRLLGWHSRPDYPKALIRFNPIIEFMKKLVANGIFSKVVEQSYTRLLDVMATSGISGVALAKTLIDENVTFNS